MADREQVNMLVDAERKARWIDHANQKERSLSGLIRLAVEKEISSDGSTMAAGPDSAEIRELRSAVEDIGAKIDGLHSRMADLEQQVQRESPEVRELASEVFDILPTEEDVIQATHEAVINQDGSGDRSLIQTGRPPHLAAHLGVEEVRVSEALQKLREDTAQVESRSIDGQIRYFKEE